MSNPPFDQKAQERAALLVSALSAFLMPFMVSAVNVAMPAMQEALRLRAVTMTWVPASYMLAMTITILPAGNLADMYGRKRFFTLGLWVYCLASLLAGCAWSGGALILFRVLQGLGAGLFTGPAMAILTSVFPPERRGRALGLHAAAVYIGLSAGPFAGGALTGLFGWRAIFFATLPLGALCLLLAKRRLKGEWAEAGRAPFDRPGFLLYATAVASLAYGASVIASPAGIALLLVGALCGLAFFLHQMKSPHPVLDTLLFTNNRVFAFSCLAALLNYSATFAATFLISMYLQYIQGMSPQGAGLVLIAQPLMMAAGSPLSGRLSERIEARWLATGGMAVTALGIACCASFGQETSPTRIVVTLAVLGAGLAFFSAPNTNAVMGAVERRRYGVAAGIVAMMRLLGQMASMGIATATLALMVGNVPVTPEIYPRFLVGIRTVFACSALLCCVGVYCSFARGRGQTRT